MQSCHCLLSALAIVGISCHASSTYLSRIKLNLYWNGNKGHERLSVRALMELQLSGINVEKHSKRNCMHRHKFKTTALVTVLAFWVLIWMELNTNKPTRGYKKWKQWKQQLTPCHTEVFFVKGIRAKKCATFQTPAAQKTEGRKKPALWSKAHFPLGCTLLQAG